MEKARLKANGDWSKWEEFQTRTNARLERALIGWRALRGRGLPMTEDERIALWWVVRTPELPWLMAPPRRPRRPGWPLRRAQRPRATALEPALGPHSPMGRAKRRREDARILRGRTRPENAAGPRSTRASDQVSKLLIHVAGTIPRRADNSPLPARHGRQRAWLGLWPAIGEPLNSEPMIGNAGR
jgi:hypothetical protein